MLSRIHDVPVDLRTNNDADTEDDNFHMVRNTPKHVKILHSELLYRLQVEIRNRA